MKSFLYDVLVVIFAIVALIIIGMCVLGIGMLITGDLPTDSTTAKGFTGVIWFASFPLCKSLARRAVYGKEDAKAGDNASEHEQE